MRLNFTFLMMLMLMVFMAMPAFGQFYDGSYGSTNQYNGWANQQAQQQQWQRQQNMNNLATPGGWGTPSFNAQLLQQQMLQEQRRANQYQWESLQQNQRSVACGILPTHRYAREGC